MRVECFHTRSILTYIITRTTIQRRHEKTKVSLLVVGSLHLSMDTSIFKSYDIRGLSPEQLDVESAYAIGRAYTEEFSLTSVAIGRDERATSPTLLEAFARGVADSGADVIDLGTVSTPMVYYASATLDVDGAVSLTASHNPAAYNGFKLNLKNAVPIGAGTGMERVRDRAVAGLFATPAQKGAIRRHDILPEYVRHILSFAHLDTTPLTVVVDCGNGMGVSELPILRGLGSHVTLHTLYDSVDMSFPHHEANPLNTDTLADLQARVRTTSAQLGLAYDGDADRVGFVDEQGAVVRMDTITSIIAEDILRSESGATILFDLRSSRAVKEHIESCGGVAVECRVGHAHIKRQMAECGAVFAGELSGHYYFKDNSYAESATLAAVRILNVMARTGKPLSSLVREVERYVHSGEINSTVGDTRKVLDALEKKYSDGVVSHLDGLKVTFPHWWFSVRVSNTEPALRLNLEADTQPLMEAQRDILLSNIRSEY